MVTVIVEELRDEVNVGQEHPPAAVSLELKCVQRLSNQQTY